MTAGQWLYDWQTLISGGLAVAAAAGSVILLRKQIRQAEEHEKHRHRRRSIAARATLPLTLDQIVRYVESNAKKLLSIRTKSGVELVFDARTRFDLNIPNDLVTSLERMIEATDDALLIGYLAATIRDMQILSSNLKGLNDEIEYTQVTSENIKHYLVYCAKIYALANHLFPYARRRVASVTAMEREDMDNAFRAIGADTSYAPASYAEIAAIR